MNKTPMSDEQWEALWGFVRGDMTAADFESWLYSQTELERTLGSTLYLEVLEVDYRSSRAVHELRNRLNKPLRASRELRCSCVTLGSPTVVDMGDASDIVFETLEEKNQRGDPFWWLSTYACRVCQQWWLVAQEERHNDVYCLRRLQTQEVHGLSNDGVWPADFDRYETLLDLGLRSGRSVDFVDPMESSLSSTMADLARERPGISVSELARLLNLDFDLAMELARRVKEEDGVDIRTQ